MLKQVQHDKFCFVIPECFCCESIIKKLDSRFRGNDMTLGESNNRAQIV